MRRSDFLLALISSRLVLMVIEIGLLLGFGVLAFHMRVLGSLFSIVLLASLGAVSFGGLGLLVASRADKIESVSGLMNLVMMPMWIFSGVFFSSERFPALLQPFIKAAAPDGAQRCACVPRFCRARPSGPSLEGCWFWCFGAAFPSYWLCAGSAGLSMILQASSS